MKIFESISKNLFFHFDLKFRVLNRESFYVIWKTTKRYEGNIEHGFNKTLQY